MIYEPRHFTLMEMLPKDFYKANKHKGQTLWWLFDQRVLITADKLRDRYGKIIMNTWHTGGKHQFRGWRPFDCKIGALNSQHKFGRALDLVPVQVTAQELREDLENHPDDEAFKYITCVEKEVSWFHFDVRNWLKDKSGLFFINP